MWEHRTTCDVLNGTHTFLEEYNITNSAYIELSVKH